MFYQSIALALLGNIDFSKYDIFLYSGSFVLYSHKVSLRKCAVSWRNSDKNTNEINYIIYFLCSTADHILNNFIGSLTLNQERLTKLIQW